jgi:hypothetical protein
MAYWKKEPFKDFLDEGYFAVVEAGPLYTPINAWKVKRDDKLNIIVETIGDEETENKFHLDRADIPAGTLRVNTDRVKLKSQLLDTTVLFEGISAFNTEAYRSQSHGKREVRQVSKVRKISATVVNDEPAVFTIDYLENVPSYQWPDPVSNTVKTIETRVVGRPPHAITLTTEGESSSRGMATVRLELDGTEFYVVSSTAKDEGQIRPGYILYVGTPTQEFRRKVRAILSFSLGAFLVYLGTAAFTEKWHLKSFSAYSAYSMDMRAFGLPAHPPTLLGDRGVFEVRTAQMQRLVSALYETYDMLNFGSLNWGYWHAVTAPVHIAAVHYGALIEALQRRYIDAHLADFPTRNIPDGKQWSAFAAYVDQLIGKLDIPDPAKVQMQQNIGLLNQVPRKAQTDELLRHTGLILGKAENDAWKARHDAAHGNDTDDGDVRARIHSNRILRVMFHRMLLKITLGSDRYFDFTSLNYPLRGIDEPIPEDPKSDHGLGPLEETG